MLLMLIRRKPIVFDVHEDFETGVRGAPYLAKTVGTALAPVYRLVERLACRLFYPVLAERYYARKVPNGTMVLNYPRLDEFERIVSTKKHARPPKRIRVLYTGNMALNRGAVRVATLARRLGRDGEVVLVGRCSEDALSAMREICPDTSRLQIREDGRQVPFERILEAYAEPWTAAVALFFDSEHSREKELTKFFEYMAAGIPIIASDFPVWRELIEGNGVGRCVDPGNVKEVEEAVRSLHGQPMFWRSMGDTGRRLVRERYSWTSEARRLLALYDELVGSSVCRPDDPRAAPPAKARANADEPSPLVPL
jgi:glycosyltransferase involved in cell wall biosynthesis